MIRKVLIATTILAAPATYAQSIPDLVEIEGGYFHMGSDGYGHDFDEAPIRRIFISPFRMSTTEITNKLYEEFDPSHRSLRGKNGISSKDDEPVVYVSYNDAKRYCQWLSEKNGRSFRLPTEAEWEYACRAGSYTRYNTGDWLPEENQRNQTIARDYAPVDLTVATTKPNAWGLHEMHGNVEEWCLDSYGTYDTSATINPVNNDEDAEFRVTRGGSHHTPLEFLRSANRSATLPDDKSALIGFRIVESSTTLCGQREKTTKEKSISQTRFDWNKSHVDTALYIPPKAYVIPPVDRHTPFYRHNHQPAVTWCDNGDILATWFSADAENGREIVVLSSRLSNDTGEWTPGELFYRVPDRNLTGTSLFNRGDGTLLHMNGLEAAGDWQNLALIRRFSHDNGMTWSKAELVEPEHAKRHQVIAGPIKTKDGMIIQLCDAGPDGHAGSAVHISTDGGVNWSDQIESRTPTTEFENGGTGNTIAGIHAGIVELSDGALLALGRGNIIKNKDGIARMPQSISYDQGKTWHYSPSPFPPIDGGQRLVLMRLKEGPILLISFTDHPQRTPESDRGMMFKQKDGTSKMGYGLYAALSYDEGKTWPIRKLITDGEYRFLNGGAWTGYFESDSQQAEPRGYMAAVQSPDGTIHLLSSRLHYQFNLPWLEQKP